MRRSITQPQRRSCEVLKQPDRQHLAACVAILRTGTPVDLLNERAQFRWYAGRPGQVGREAKILARKRQRESLVVIAVTQHRQHIGLDEVTGGRARQQAGTQYPEVNAGGNADGKHLGGRAHVREPQQVEHELDGVAGPVRADMTDPFRIPHRLEYRPHALVVIVGPADEDLQRPGPSARRHPADRCVDHANAARLGKGSDPVGDLGHAGGHVDPDRTRLQAVEQAVGVEQYPLDISRRGQTSDHDIASRGRLERSRRPPGTCLKKRPGRCRAGVVHDQVMARGEDVAAHGRAHLAEADESDFHRSRLSLPLIASHFSPLHCQTERSVSESLATTSSSISAPRPGASGT